MDRSWRVVYRGPVASATPNTFYDGRMIYTSGHGGRGRESMTFFVMAPTSAAAEAMVDKAVGGRGHVDTAAPLPFVIAIGVPEEEADAIDDALGDPWARHLTALIEREPADGFAEFLLEAVADSEQEAVEQVRETYRMLRDKGGLPPADVQVLYVNAPWVGPQPLPHRALLNRTEQLLHAGQPDLAVVIAQTAFETLVRDTAKAELDTRQLGALRSRVTFSSYSLADKRQRKLWDDLMDDEIGRCPAWDRYSSHVVRRNLIVHEGRPMGLDDASDSLEAVDAMINYVEELLRNRTATPGLDEL